MQKKRRNIFWYFLAPMILEWVISFVVQTGVEVAYMVRNIEQVEKVVGNETAFVEFMNKMILVLNQYATEITTLVAISTLPFLVLMYKKDKTNVQEWWAEKTAVGVRESSIIGIMALSVCVAVNNFIMLSGVMTKSPTYMDTAELIYTSPLIIQIIGLGIIVPVMEEMIYRGLLFRRMREYLPVIPAVFGSATVFGIYHGNLVQIIYATVIGIFLAYLYEHFRTLKAPITFHVVANLTSLICTWSGAFEWIFSSFMHVALITVLLSMLAAGMLMLLKNCKNHDD